VSDPSGRWPAIDDPELLHRLRLGDEEFREYVRRIVVAVPPRPYTEDELAHALGYPWARPPGSYRLAADGTVAPLADPAPEELAGRLPLLAIGSNAAPEVLERKFAHFEDPADREVFALAGHLHGFDVGASAQPTLYGSMPATIFPSPGTRVATTLLWVTPTQFVQLTWSEVSYFLGRLRTRFEVAGSEAHFDEVLVFVSRFGAFTVDGEPVALAAVPAEGRTAPALTQRQVLDAAAALALGEGADAADLVRTVCEDMGALAPRVAATVWPRSRPFASERWTPFPTPAPGGDSRAQG
jgi:hypothetical protein